MLTLTPKQLWPKQDHQPQDVVFVIDTSGSMSGEKLEQAQAALKYCVDQLDERDRFNLVRFSTGVDPLFQEVQPATRENRERARERIARFAAAGGTNITDALKAALDLRSVGQDAAKDADPRPPFIIVFITDGMGNASAQDTLKVVKEHPASPDARIFSFGVGHDVNTLFLDQLATTFAGKPTYVQPGENLELVLGDFFAVISQPVLTNLKLALPEVGITERFPATLGDLYHGQQLIIAGKFENAGSGPVKLTATRNGEVQEFIWKDVSFNHTPQAKYVPAIWAGRKIAFLIDEIRAHGESKEMVDEVVTLGQEYGIQTPYTSWLVNPDQPRIVAGRPMRSPQDPMVRERASRAMQGAGFEELKSNASPATSSGREPAPADLLRQQSGESATTLAMQNARMRDSRSADDGGRVDETQLGSRDIAGRRYNRIGKFLVDEAFDEQTRTTIVRFGSNAYFELVAARPELQPAFAASRNIVLRWRENEAVIIAEDRGIEDLSPDQLKQLGLDARTD